jgi:S-DNA-T family DNA segregation ATPase FtsK/SpoIIIE
MMRSRKSAPSVKIPTSVLRREAQKAAKKMMIAEKKKEKIREAREKAKEKVKGDIEKKKLRTERNAEIFNDTVQRELWASGWIVLAGILIAIFSSDAMISQSIARGILWLCGLGAWALPIIAIGTGITLLTKRDFEFLPIRVIALAGLGVSLLGIVNLFVPHADSLALAHEYGGVIGFTIGFFPREFLGTGVTAVILLGCIWLCSTVGFNIRWSDFFASKETLPVRAKGSISSTNATELSSLMAEKKEEIRKSRFENELEIVDTTRADDTKKIVKNVVQLEQRDELTEAKNRMIEGQWEPPSIEILVAQVSTITVNEKKLRDDADKIREKLEQFGIDVTMKSVHVGPTVTQFTLEPAPGVKLTKITGLKNDLALTLAAESIRIEAPIRGKSLVGIEIPNEKRATVGMREIIESEAWAEEKSSLKLAVGRDVAGKPIVIDLAKMPHLLIAGKTGSGKSVGMNAFLCSLLWNNSPANLRLILIDPKRVELKRYDKLPHLLTPVIVEPEKSVSALAWAVAEMNRRYRMLAEASVVNLDQYNEKHPEKKEPKIVIVIDELADLMMVAGKDVEAAVVRIAQLARAVGMHLIVATQRPSVDVVTGLIKANLPARIAFRVSSQIDSRTIIDGMGAESLLGLGDMLSLDGNSGALTRVQGIYISNEEVSRIANHIKLQFPEMIANDEVTNHSIEGMAKGGVLTAGMKKEVEDDDLDDIFEEAVNLVLETGTASASFLQRRLEIGYARAARILDQMEGRGIIGPARGAKAREIFGRKG